MNSFCPQLLYAVSSYAQCTSIDSILCPVSAITHQTRQLDQTNHVVHHEVQVSLSVPLCLCWCHISCFCIFSKVEVLKISCVSACVRSTSWQRHNIEKFLYPPPRLPSGGGGVEASESKSHCSRFCRSLSVVCQEVVSSLSVVCQKVGTPCHQTSIRAEIFLTQIHKANIFKISENLLSNAD